jgi:hypothetical protein
LIWVGGLEERLQEASAIVRVIKCLDPSPPSFRLVHSEEVRRHRKHVGVENEAITDMVGGDEATNPADQALGQFGPEMFSSRGFMAPGQNCSPCHFELGAPCENPGPGFHPTIRSKKDGILFQRSMSGFDA